MTGSRLKMVNAREQPQVKPYIDDSQALFLQFYCPFRQVTVSSDRGIGKVLEPIATKDGKTAAVL
jgi:hypothetical protein